MRKEPIVVAPRALLADGDAPNSASAGLIREDRAKIDAGRFSRITPRQLSVDVGTDLIAASTDRWPEVNSGVCDVEPGPRQLGESAAENARDCAAPTGVQGQCSAARVHNKNGDTIRDGDCHRGAPCGSEVPVGIFAAQPPPPRSVMNKDAGTMDLSGRREPRRNR